jgi:hypothetical protein
VEKLERDHLENVGVDGKIILTLIFKSWNGAGNGLILLRIETGGGLCEFGNEPWCFIKRGELLHYLWTS